MQKMCKKYSRSYISYKTHKGVTSSEAFKSLKAGL